MSFSRRGSATLLSLAIHLSVIAILCSLGGIIAPVRTPVIREAPRVRLLDPWRGSDSGGGGGNRSKTPPSFGRLPPHRTFSAPIPVRQSVTQPLLVEPAPSLVADVHVDTKMLPFGDPQGVPGPPSSGPGRDGGIGDGEGPGYGSRNGPGGGDGEPGIGIGPTRGGLTPPVLVWKIDPDYSDPARAAKVQGVVMLRVEIDSAGRIRGVSVDRGLGLGLDEKAVEAVRRWRFLPGTRNGRAVVTSAIVEVHFRLL